MPGSDDVSHPPGQRRYRFGDVTVIPESFRVSRRGVPVRLEPKAFEVLVYLAERAGEAVSKQELLDSVWKGTFVTDNALSRTVAQIRKALGDDLQSPRYIETIPTRGYRLIAPLVDASEDGPPAERIGSRLRMALAAAVLAALVALSFLIFRSPQTEKTSARGEIGAHQARAEIGAHQLTGYLGLDLFPAFSPDGSSVAYSSDHAGSLHIYISQLEGGREIQVTSGEDGEIQPAWSPDGRTLAFVSATRGGIWLVPALGGTPVQLTDIGSRPAWSPDGRQIAFQSGVQLEFSATVFESFPPSALWIVEVATGQTRALTQSGTPSGGHGSPHWSPDGKRIVFVSSNLKSSTVYSISRDGSSLRQILTGASHLGSPVYGSDGRTLYYLENPTDADSRLSRVALEDDEKLVGKPVILRRSSPGKMHYLARSKDGNHMAWSVIEQTSSLMSLSLDSNGGSRGDATLLITNTNVRNTVPEFSPDGRKLTYCSIPAGQQSDVWLSSVDGSETRVLASEPGDKFFPHWSRDGSEVSYTIISSRGCAVHSTSLRTGRSRKVCELPDVTTNTSISPDGRTIAFDRRIGGAISVWTMALDGRSLRQLTTSTDRAGCPVWSPRGDRLAVSLLFSGGSALGTISASGGLPQALTPQEGESWPSSWSPDGKLIAFAGRRRGVWNIWSAEAAGGTPQQLTRYTSPARWVRFPAWSPDGARIVYEMGVPTGNIWISDALHAK